MNPVLSNNVGGFAQEIGEYEFKLPFLAPLGFYLLEKIPYGFNSAYDRQIRAKITNLYGCRRVGTFFAVHTAQKIVLLAVTVFFLGIILLTAEVDYSFFFLGFMITGLVFYWVDRDLDRKLRVKRRKILIDLPEFINTLALLINAGLSFSGAVQKIIRDGDSSRPLYKELNRLSVEISTGKPIHQAYEDLAQRCKVPEITRFVSTVLPNMNRGSSDVVHVLRILAREAWEKRKDIARKQGEEAGAKLVFPMVMVFMAVAIIVLAPAIMTMSR